MTNQNEETNGSLIRIKSKITEDEALIVEDEELPIEMRRFLDDEDLKKIDSLKYKELYNQIINTKRKDSHLQKIKEFTPRERLEAETDAEALLKIKRYQETISEDKIKENVIYN